MHLTLTELRHKMFLRDLYKKRFNEYKDPEDWQKFKEFRNAVNKERPKKKQLFFTEKLYEVRDNIKDIWKVLNMAMGNKLKATNINCKKKLSSDPSKLLMT